MKNELDLHGIRHTAVERLVEHFVLLNEPPLTIITGNSQRMTEIVINTLVTHDINFERWSNSEIKIL